MELVWFWIPNLKVFRIFLSTGRFINDWNSFFENCKVYPKELDIEIKDGIFVYKLIDKRDHFLFEIVAWSNIPSNIMELYFTRIKEMSVALCDLKISHLDWYLYLKEWKNREFLVVISEHILNYFEQPMMSLVGVLFAV